VRRECFDHVFIPGERHLMHVLREYALDYFNDARPHQGLGQRIPVPGERLPLVRPGAVAIPVLGGLHHDYRTAA
jgi:putative transposase